MQRTIFQDFVVPFAIFGLLLAALLTLREHWALERAEHSRANLVAEEGKARAYVARRRMECYDIYTRERAEFSNIEFLNYDHDSDRCEIIYGYSGSKETNFACLATQDADSTSNFYRNNPKGWLKTMMDCEDNNFRKEF